VIEEDQAAGTYVYKTVDPVTGKVISQIPREQLLKMRETPDYTPGSIVNARG
jgi:flagellar protein FlaG